MRPLDPMLSVRILPTAALLFGSCAERLHVRDKRARREVGHAQTINEGREVNENWDALASTAGLIDRALVAKMTGMVAFQQLPTRCAMVGAVDVLLLLKYVDVPSDQ